jgi:hypothetical protein
MTDPNFMNTRTIQKVLLNEAASETDPVKKALLNQAAALSSSFVITDSATIPGKKIPVAKSISIPLRKPPVSVATVSNTKSVVSKQADIPKPVKSNLTTANTLPGNKKGQSEIPDSVGNKPSSSQRVISTNSNKLNHNTQKVKDKGYVNSLFNLTFIKFIILVKTSIRYV